MEGRIMNQELRIRGVNTCYCEKTTADVTLVP
jgi:hypothetical protein